MDSLIVIHFTCRVCTPVGSGTTSSGTVGCITDWMRLQSLRSLDRLIHRIVYNGIASRNAGRSQRKCIVCSSTGKTLRYAVCSDTQYHRQHRGGIAVPTMRGRSEVEGVIGTESGNRNMQHYACTRRACTRWLGCGGEAVEWGRKTPVNLRRNGIWP